MKTKSPTPLVVADYIAGFLWIGVPLLIFVLWAIWELTVWLT